MLLTFDTATPSVTVAVCAPVDDTGTVQVRAAMDVVDARRHGELLAPGIRATLDRASITTAELTHVVVGTGPGPYTGLRVGIATAHALARALGIACHGLPTLDAIAATSERRTPFLVASDARRKEVFWARYQDADTRSGEIAVSRPADLGPAIDGLPVLGQGAALYPDELGGKDQEPEPLYPTAAALGRLAARALASGAELAEARPLYLRRPDAQPPAVPKRVAQERYA